MAEYVEQALQDMVPELDDLRRKRIFNDDEIRIIVKRRRDFEYQLQKTQPRQQDFLGYVKYEIALDCLRRKRSRERKYKRRTLSDLAGIRRCHGILNSACRKFKGDKRMWYQHLDFCLRSGSTKVMSAVVTKALRLHPREVHFWLLAADRELKLGHITSARTLLVRGLRFAPKAAKLWGEFLRLEVRVALHVRLTKSLGNDKTVEEPKEEEAAEGSDAPSQPKSRWGAARLIVRKALGSLSLSPSATASFLRQAVECLREAEAAPPEEDGMKEWVDDVTAALAEKRPGIAEGQEWAEASEEASISLWQLWWDRTVEVGGTWGTVAQAAASSAPGAVLPCLATALAEAARVGAGAKQPGGGSAAAAAALAHLAEAPRTNPHKLRERQAPSASAASSTALALLEALERCAEADSEAPAADKAVATEVAKKLLQTAAAAHSKSGRLHLLAAAAQDDGKAPRGLAVAPIARVARRCEAHDAASLLLLGGESEAGSTAGSSAERRRLLEALLRHLAADESPAPVVVAHVAAALARDGPQGVRAACDEVRDIASTTLWERPTRRAMALATALDCELRFAPTAAMVAGGAGLQELAKRIAARFEELLDCLADDDPEKEDWWVRYSEFSWRASQWNLAGQRGGGSVVPTITDIHVRAMRSVGNQARYSEKAADLLRRQGGGAS